MEARDSQSSKLDKENQPNLFLFTEKKAPEIKKVATDQSNDVIVYIKIMEINLLKIQPHKASQDEATIKGGELSEYKRQYNFKVLKQDISKCKILKNNYLPEEEIIEIALPMNLHLYAVSFEAIHQVILALIAKEDQKLAYENLKIEDHNYFDIFAAACCLELEELALKIYEAKVKQKLSVRLLIDLLLLSLEYNLSQLSFKFYQIFREYWVFREGLSDKSNAVIDKLFDAKDGSCILYDKDQLFHVFDKQEPLFTFSPNILKKSFEAFRKLHFNKYMKPETRYHILKILRKRNHNGDEAIWQSSYPHKYSMVYDHKDEIIISGARYTEYGIFYLFGNEPENEVIYGQNYVGCIEPNAWGTSFDIFDHGLDEKRISTLPSCICNPRQKIATITYDTNILGEAPRTFKVKYCDFLEKKVSNLESMKPKFDAKHDCYTLNFYGRAKKASARNFILIHPDDPDSIILMHGKTGKDAFNLDFRHPLNFIQAFSISLVSIGKKFCVA